MIRTCIVVAGIVENVVIAENGFIAENGLAIASETANIGDFYNDGVFTSAPVPLEGIRATMQCSAWQFRRALSMLNLRVTVEAAVALADQDTKDMWEYAVTIERMNPFVVAMGALLEKTDAEIDAVFELALTIT